MCTCFLKNVFTVFVFCEGFPNNDLLNVKEFCKHRIVRMENLASNEEFRNLPLSLQTQLLFEADALKKKTKVLHFFLRYSYFFCSTCCYRLPLGGPESFIRKAMKMKKKGQMRH